MSLLLRVTTLHVLRGYKPIISVSIPVSCLEFLYPSEANIGYRTEGQDTEMDIEITGQ